MISVFPPLGINVMIFLPTTRPGLFTFTLLLFCFLSTRNGFAQESSDNASPKAQNVILLIGDGMGLSQMSSIYFQDVETVHFDEFTNIGLIKTWSADAKITDSASSATSYAAGIKT